MAESLNKVHFKNIVECLDSRIHSNVSVNFLKRICSGWTHLSIRPFEPDQLIRMDELSVLEGLSWFRLVCPHLRSLSIINHCFEKTAFQFGSRCVKINNVNYLDLLEIIGENCVNLEEVNIYDAGYCTKMKCSTFTSQEIPQEMRNRILPKLILPKLMTMIVKKNPKLWSFTVYPSKFGFHRICPDEITMPSLRHITIYLTLYSVVKQILLLTEKLSVIELDCCFIRGEQVSDFVNQILLQKNLQRLRINLYFHIDNDYDYVQQNIDKLAALRNCLYLREFKIEINEVANKKLSGNFIKDIIKGCRRLEVIQVANLIIDNETHNQLRSLPYAKDILITSKPLSVCVKRYDIDYFTSKL